MSGVWSGTNLSILFTVEWSLGQISVHSKKEMMTPKTYHSDQMGKCAPGQQVIGRSYRARGQTKSIPSKSLLVVISDVLS
jgi:hypothetical protein